MRTNKYVEKGGMQFVGKSTLWAFDRGVIPGLLEQGFSLTETIGIAKDAGHCRAVNEVNNLVVTIGKQLVGDFMIGASVIGLTWHALGTGTTAPGISDTTLTTESTRQAIEVKTRAGNTITLSTFYLASECTLLIKEGGIFGNAASATPGSGTLFSHFLQEYDNSAGLYDLTFEYNCEVK